MNLQSFAPLNAEACLLLSGILSKRRKRAFAAQERIEDKKRRDHARLSHLAFMAEYEFDQQKKRELAAALDAKWRAEAMLAEEQGRVMVSFKAPENYMGDVCYSQRVGLVCIDKNRSVTVPMYAKNEFLDAGWHLNQTYPPG